MLLPMLPVPPALRGLQAQPTLGLLALSAGHRSRGQQAGTQGTFRSRAGQGLQRATAAAKRSEAGVALGSRRRQAWSPGRPRPGGRTAGCCGRAGPRWRGAARRAGRDQGPRRRGSAGRSGSGTSPRAVEAARLVPGWLRATARAGSAAVRSAAKGLLGCEAIRARSAAASRA